MELYKDMIGNRYGNWIVLGYSHFKEKSYYCNTRKKIRHGKEHFLKVKCKCGVIRSVRPQPLKSGKSKGCGCEGGQIKTQFQPTHGKTNTRLYRIYRGMKSRCYETKDKDFYKYGGRGIAVCNEWLDDFQNFYDWAKRNGYNKNLTIDRIDNNGNYEPGNCRWVDMRTQSNNRRGNVNITYKNKTLTASEWSRLLNVRADTLHNRKRLGWTDEEIISTPIRKYGL